jgi:single-strand DNA-binding protein
MKNLQNSVQLIGRLGADPEVKTFENGKSVANFRLATKETYKNGNGEKVSNTQWHNIVAWNATALFLKDYVGKGDEIALEGKLTHRSYEDKEGQKKYITEILANEILPLRQNSKTPKTTTANA